MKLKVWIFGIGALVAAIILMVAFNSRRYENVNSDVSGQKDPQTSPVSGEMFKVDDLDWQLGRGKLADALRPHFSESLYEFLEDGLRMNRLAADAQISLDDGIARIILRDGVVWSDGTPLTSDHFAEALERAKAALATDTNDWSQLELQMVRSLGIITESKSSFTLTGILRPEWIPTILSGQLLRPVREDTKSLPGSRWSIVIGRYRPSEATAFPASEMTLEPNPKYYRGQANKPLTIEVMAASSGMHPL